MLIRSPYRSTVLQLGFINVSLPYLHSIYLYINVDDVDLCI